MYCLNKPFLRTSYEVRSFSMSTMVTETSSVLLTLRAKNRATFFLYLVLCFLLRNCLKISENAPKNAKMMVYKKRLIDHYTCLPRHGLEPANAPPSHGRRLSPRMLGSAGSLLLAVSTSAKPSPGRFYLAYVQHSPQAKSTVVRVANNGC